MNHARRDEEWLSYNRPQDDPVNSPSHYTHGRRFEVIDVLEDWVSRAPDPVTGSQLFNALKYQARLFDKDDPLVDAKKAKWYLERLISVLESRKVEESLDDQVDLWDPSLGPTEPGVPFDSTEDIPRDLSDYEFGQIVKTQEKPDGSIYGITKDGSEVLLRSADNLYDQVLKFYAWSVTEHDSANYVA